MVALLRRFGVLALVLVACGGHRQPPNVLIIAVDSLRPDHLGCYGYGRPTSPEIDALAGRGVLLERVISQASWTTPSFGTVLTGLYPSQHGALTITNMLAPAVPTLATILKAQGYATCGIVNAPALGKGYGFDRGFDLYDVAEPETRDAGATTGDALAWIDRNKAGPFFLFLHYFDVHLPYAPPAPFDRVFDQTYSGSMGSRFDPETYAPTREDLLAMMGRWPAAEWDHVVSLYDGEIAFTDRAMGALLNGLRERGLLENTLLVLLSDHGQEFFEHGAYGHGHSLYGEVLAVPLVFSLPGRIPEGRRVREQARLLDVMPTILDILGVEPGTRVEGASLLPLIAGGGGVRSAPDAVLPPEMAFSEAVRLGGEKKALTGPGAKTIHDVNSGETVVFDLAADPGEANALSDADASEIRPIVATMFDAIFEMTETWHVEIDGGGLAHDFGIAAASSRGERDGRIYLARAMTADGRIRPVGNSGAAPAGPAGIDIKDLAVSDRFQVAFKAAPRRFPVNFNFTMDGKPAQAITYLGEDLVNPDGMPFAQMPGKAACKSRGEPASRPHPPYILVWLAGAAADDETAANLSDQARQQLRALGYLQ
jgi:arylsulfatase A-like enzyme